jgi:hypothetical protein
MKKQYKKAIRRGDAKPQDGKTSCSICGGYSIWREVHYCFKCRQVYAIQKKDHLDGHQLRGYVDGQEKNQMAGFKYIKVLDLTNGIGGFKLSIGVKRSRLEDVTGISSVVMDIPKGGTDEMIKIDPEEFKELNWTEEVVTLKGVQADVKVRFLDDQPTIPVLVSYEIKDFDKHMAETIPGLLEKKK